MIRGEAHLDRFFIFSARLGDTIKKIPEVQMTRSVKKAQVRHMCSQLKPTKLWRLVSNAVEAGQDDRPAAGREYNSDWNQNAKSDPDTVADIIYKMCGYLDGIKRKGFEARSASTRSDARALCRP